MNEWIEKSFAIMIHSNRIKEEGARVREWDGTEKMPLVRAVKSVIRNENKRAKWNATFKDFWEQRGKKFNSTPFSVMICQPKINFVWKRFFFVFIESKKNLIPPLDCQCSSNVVY